MKDKALNTVTINVYTPIDRTTPTCVSSGGDKNWRKAVLILTGTCDDAMSECQKKTITKTFKDDINTTTATPGDVLDNAGNKTTCPQNQTVKIDNTPPTCTIAKSNTDTISGVTITVNCSDSGSGCKSSSDTYSKVKKTTPYKISDNLGNSNTCEAKITITTKYRSRARTCNTYARCKSAGCAKYNYDACCSGYNYEDCTTEQTSDIISMSQCRKKGGTYSNGTRETCNDNDLLFACVICYFSKTTCGTPYCHKWCAGSCKTYKRGASCGCEKYNNWGDWSKYTTKVCSATNYIDCDSAQFYS